MVNELYIKPCLCDNDNEEYIEILLPNELPSPSYIFEYGLVIIDHSYILDYYDFNTMDISTGSDDINNENKLIVISNNQTTPNVHFFFRDMNLRATGTQALLLIKKPTATTDINKLEFNQIIKPTGLFIQLTHSAPLTNGNKAVLKRLMVDVVVYQNNQHDEDVIPWMRSIESTWTGRSHLLPTGNDDLLDKLSLARCDRATLTGYSFKHDRPTPGTTNLCNYNGEESSQVREPAGLSLLQSNQANALTQLPEASVVAPDTSSMEALPENRVSNWMEQLKFNGMVVKNSEDFFMTASSRKFYSFLPNPENFKRSSIRCELCYRTHNNPSSNLVFEGTISNMPNIMKETGQQFRLLPSDTWRQINIHERDFKFHKDALNELTNSGLTDQSDVYEEIPPRNEL